MLMITEDLPNQNRSFLHIVKTAFDSFCLSIRKKIGYISLHRGFAPTPGPKKLVPKKSHNWSPNIWYWKNSQSTSWKQIWFRSYVLSHTATVIIIMVTMPRITITTMMTMAMMLATMMMMMTACLVCAMDPPRRGRLWGCQPSLQNINSFLLYHHFINFEYSIQIFKHWIFTSNLWCMLEMGKDWQTDISILRLGLFVESTHSLKISIRLV